MPGIPGSHERLMHRALGWPDHWPWLGAYVRESCGGTGAAQASRLLVRSASNAYFAQTMSVISMPEPGGAIRAAVDPVWTEFLQHCESKADVTRESEFGTTSCVLRARTTPWRVGKVESPRYGSVMLTNRFDAAQMNGSTAAGSICCA